MAYDNTKDLFGDNGNKQTSTTYTGKAQTIVLDAVIGPNTATHRVVSGDIKDAENSTIKGGQ